MKVIDKKDWFKNELAQAEFYEKFTKKRFGGGSVFLAAHPDEVWQWIEQQIKQARVDELQKISTLRLGYPDEYLGKWDDIMIDYLEKRTKELTGELK